MDRTPTAVPSQIPCAMRCRRGTMRSRTRGMISKAPVLNLVCITSHKWCLGSRVLATFILFLRTTVHRKSRRITFVTLSQKTLTPPPPFGSPPPPNPAQVRCGKAPRRWAWRCPRMAASWWPITSQVANYIPKCNVTYYHTT